MKATVHSTRALPANVVDSSPTNRIKTAPPRKRTSTRTMVETKVLQLQAICTAPEALESKSENEACPMASIGGEASKEEEKTGGEGETTAAPSWTAAASSSSSSKPPRLQSLPLDSLHCIASFLTPSEWCNNLGLVNKAANAQCREIVRRVRMHGFKCATEVISAWKVGQCEDAKELAALYVSAGVPIYTRCLGHAYQTVRWRMKVEAKENPHLHTLDPFYGTGRLQFRAQQTSSSGLTYLEEKLLFFAKPLEGTRRGSFSGVNRGRFSPPTSLVGQESSATAATSATNNNDAEDSPSTAKLFMPIHQHLLDQHRLGEYYVDDKEGNMTTPLVSLSADFFHPTSRYPRTRKKRMSRLQVNRPATSSPAMAAAGAAAANNGEDNTLVDGAALHQAPQPPNLASDIDDVLAAPHPGLASAFKLVEPETYSSVCSTEHTTTSTTSHSTTESPDDSQEVRQHMRSRFATYQRRLEGFLAKRDLCGFEECMLDMWDEFFPHTAGIHYYDMETAVPRISCMQKFLTKPCPKAIGTVQCEIERIKINSRGKGVNVTGRVFPTYEYRLFIRDRSASNSNGEALEENGDVKAEANNVRRDTLLIVAKNRGRKHAELNGALPMAAASRKGSNNYYLYMPQQRDVDAHFNKANDRGSNRESLARLVPNGASHEPVLASDDAGSVLLGRLQSNFFGTEFQIFTPRLRTVPRQKMEPMLQQRQALSEDELDYDSGVSSDNASLRRSRRFSRLSLRRSNHASDISVGSNNSSVALDRPAKVKRTLSSPEISHRQPRTNRRAIANDATKPSSSSTQSAMVEEEDGAITYTANILGSRPRIMDVCIPKVTPEGVAGAEWKGYLENCDDTDNTSMLSCFRQVQQHLDQSPTPVAAAQDNNNANHLRQDVDSDNDAAVGSETDYGLMALQNRPPWWNVELGSFVLNFGGRVSVASVKNFQLCERTDHDTVMLQFGRIDGRHSFTMDFQHPLTAVQAFSIAISSLQSKISFG